MKRTLAWILLLFNIPPLVYLMVMMFTNKSTKEDVDWVLLQSIWSCWLNLIVALLVLMESILPWLTRYLWMVVLLSILCVVTLFCQWIVSFFFEKQWWLWFWFQIYIGVLNMMGWILLVALSLGTIRFYEPLENEH
jgi:hypothetical protein